MDEKRVRGKNSKRKRYEIRSVKWGVWGLGWELEWLPGLRSGLWPLMSIHPFGAYCRIRGLDFYGNGFHLLEHSVYTYLHSLLCAVMITLFLHVSSCFYQGFSYLMCSFGHIRMSIHKIGSVFTFAVCLKVSLRSDREAVMETAYLAVSLFSLSICFTQRLSDCDCTLIPFDVLHYRDHKLAVQTHLFFV